MIYRSVACKTVNDKYCADQYCKCHCHEHYESDLGTPSKFVWKLGYELYNAELPDESALDFALSAIGCYASLAPYRDELARAMVDAVRGKGYWSYDEFCVSLEENLSSVVKGKLAQQSITMYDL